jgi:2-hydroxychromene-2-carboxylate isomerase
VRESTQRREAGVSRPVFYYDLTDPFSYLAAERINASLSVVPEWEPVLGVELGAVPAAIDRELVAARARALGLQPLRWPAAGGLVAAKDGSPGRSPGDVGRIAALAATYAKELGRAVAFSLAAFRQAFAGGHDLDQESTVLLAAAACELHPRAVLQAISRAPIAEALRRACDTARLTGVVELPAIEVQGHLFAGDDAVEQAALSSMTRG